MKCTPGLDKKMKIVPKQNKTGEKRCMKNWETGLYRVMA